MPDEQDVSAGTSPAPTGSDAADTSPASGVQDVVQPPTDRSWREVSGELERKFNSNLTRVERQLAEIAAGMAALQRPQYTAPQPQAQEYTDEQLSQLAAAGNAEATLMLNSRLAQRYAAQQTQQNQEQQLVRQQLQYLWQKHPSLNDPTSPLRQAADQHCRLLTMMGRPNDGRTTVDAVLQAIADNPSIAAQQAAPSMPGRSIPAAAALGGEAPRRQAPQPQQSHQTLTKRETEIAGRMGLSPERARQAKVNFEKRNQSGRSNITPGVAQIIEGQQ